MNRFDLIFIYEVSIGDEGSKAASKLLSRLNNIDTNRAYRGYLQDTHPFPPKTGSRKGDGNDRIAVIYDTKKVKVTNTTEARRKGLRITGGRLPAYFNVQGIDPTTNTPSPITHEVCAWHAPKPEESILIAAGWQAISQNLTPPNGNQTVIIMGDLNADFNLTPLTLPQGYKTTLPPVNSTLKSTTLKQPGSKPFSTVQDCLSGNLYDQFIIRNNLAVGDSAILNILKGIADGEFDLKQKFTDADAIYDFYTKWISDHLPVALRVGI